MGEISRFRIARTAERRPLDAGEVVPVHGRRAAPTKFTESLSKPLVQASSEGKRAEAVADEVVKHLRSLADGLLKSKGAFDPDGRGSSAEADEGLRRLDRWLVSRQPAATVADVQIELVEVARGMNPEIEPSTAAPITEVPQAIEPSTAAARITGTEAWQAMRARLGDTLMAALLASPPPMRVQDRAQRLTRLVLVAGLVDALAEDPPARLDDAEVVRALLLRTPILPSPPFPLVKYLPTRSVLARAPAFSDLYVVRDEWSCYVPGEIAHIENVLRGEYRSRLHRRVDERETTETRETDELTITERDLQSTDRASLRDQSTQETELSISVEGQVDTSGRYGPTEVRTHIGASVEYSVSESRERATEQAKEIVQRALNRVERRVREVRTTRTLSRVVEANRHIIDNAKDPEGHVVGVYRWVDKVQRFQTFRYPDRYLLEFQLPEPGALIRWLSTRREQAAGIAQKPKPFTVTGKEGDKALTAEHIDANNYASYAAWYGVTDLLKPPAEKITVSESFAVDAGTREKAGGPLATRSRVRRAAGHPHPGRVARSPARDHP